MTRGVLHAVAVLAATSWIAGATPAAAAQVVRFSTQNDVFVGGNSPDDHYTFAVALEIERPGHTVELTENAFTDRSGGVRFDETYLSVRRALPARAAWSLEMEAGLVRVGRGLFGEGAQNAVHRAIGSDEVELRYLGTEVHPRLAVAATRDLAAGERFEVAARLEADLAPGLRSLALAGVQTGWRPGGGFALELLAGARFATADYGPLEPHLETVAPAVHAALSLGDRFFVSWSYNEHGDEREHLSAGLRFSPAPRARNPD